MPRPSRKNAILEALAKELESNPGDRITTALLAKSVGVSEAALYRHFPSKARMFEALLDFAEEAVFSRANHILEETQDTRERCSQTVLLLLAFAEKNPGITRVLLGNAIVGEHERLHQRVTQFFQRFETQMRQILRESALRQDTKLTVSAEEAAGLFGVYVEGRLQQFVRSQFERTPTSTWESDWNALHNGIFSS